MYHICYPKYWYLKTSKVAQQFHYQVAVLSSLRHSILDPLVKNISVENVGVFYIYVHNKRAYMVSAISFFTDSTKNKL